MKIVKFQAENVKKLKAVEITPAGAVVQITGRNGSGKTSVLDSILWALGGKDKIQSVPIRKGTDKAKIMLDLGKFIVERRFTANNSTITVKNKEGAAYPSPQAMLDDLVGSLSFDPLAFARKAPRDQYEELKRIAKVEVDFAAIDAQNKVDFETRRDKNRHVKELRARVDAFAFTTPETVAPVDVAALVVEMQAAERHNSEIDRRIERRAEASTALAKNKATLTGLEAEYPDTIKRLNHVLEAEILKLRQEHARIIGQLDADLAEKRAAVQELDAKLASATPLPPKIDTSALAQQVQNAHIVNREYERRQERATLQSQAFSRQAEADTLTKTMESREETKRKAMESAQMPVAGISLGDGIVLLNGLPFDQASDAEQLRVSLSIAMAGNPTLRVIRVRDGSLLDDDSLRLISEMATDEDYQVWVECVDSSGKVGIVMEDGMVIADHQAEASVQLEGPLLK